MQTIDTLDTLLQVVTAGAKAFGTSPWWRGHADAGWELIPGTFRAGRTHLTEYNMAARFMAKARTRRAVCPDDTDLASWLALMQHYRLPTRLLDWTELPLAALFFAVSELQHKDGMLWMLNPYSINKTLLGTASLQGARGPQARNFVNQAFAANAVSEGRALALLPSETDMRMLLQGSAFTIHDGPSPLEEHPSAKEALVAFSVPTSSKLGLLQHLALLGVRRSTLFPDLDNLALDIATFEFADPAAEVSNRGDG